MRTLGRQRISKFPKGCDPRRYCSGSPLSLLLQSFKSFCLCMDFLGSDSKTCSVNQRSSLTAEGRLRVPRRTRGRRGDCPYALIRSEWAIRGMLRVVKEVWKASPNPFNFSSTWTGIPQSNCYRQEGF